MQLVAYDLAEHCDYQASLLPRAMASQLEWLDQGAGLTIFVPSGDGHPVPRAYSAGAIEKFADSGVEADRLRDPEDRMLWVAVLCIWAHQLHGSPR